MPDEYEVIGELANGGQQIRFLSGPLADRIVIGFPNDHPFLQDVTNDVRRRPQTPDERAESLLRSLLTAEQLRDWDGRQRFLVSTQYGVLEFGELYNIGLLAERRWGVQAVRRANPG